MPKPKGYEEEVFKSKNSYIAKAGWNLKDGAITAVKGADSTSAGMCLALSCNWLKLVHQHGIRNSSAVMSQHQLLFASIVQSSYLPRISKLYGLSSSTKESEVYEQFGLRKVGEIVVPQEWSEGDLYGAIEDWASTYKGSYASHGSFLFRISTDGHTMAMVLDLSDQQVYFFDPNHGCYRYNDRVNDILEHIENLKSYKGISWFDILCPE